MKKNFKKILSLILALSICISTAIPAFAVTQTVTTGTLRFVYGKHRTYPIDETVEGYKLVSPGYWNESCATPPEIPETIEGYPVVSLEEGFSVTDTTSTLKLKTTPEIPKYVENLNNTFRCNSLFKIGPSKIPSMVKTMKGCFQACYSMSNFPVIESQVLKNMESAFSNCRNAVGTVEIPQSVINLNSAFAGCSKMTSIPDISHLSDLEKADSCFNFCKIATGGTDLPNSPKLTSISGMFRGNRNMKTPPSVIGKNINKISYAFMDCSKLNGTIDIYANLATARKGDYKNAFTGCATSPDCEITLNYTAENEDVIDDIIATKIITANIKKGRLLGKEKPSKVPSEIEITKYPEFSYTKENGLTFDKSQFEVVGKDESGNIVNTKNFEITVDDSAFSDLAPGKQSIETTAIVKIGDKTFEVTITIIVTIKEKSPDSGEPVSPNPSNPDDNDKNEANGTAPSTPKFEGENEIAVVDGVGNQDVIIEGIVEPVNTLDVDVPIKLQFIIDENRNIHYTKNAKVISRSPAPIDVFSHNVTIPNGAPKLVANNAFPDWDNLNIAQTKSNIAISLNDKNLLTRGIMLGSIGSGFSGDKNLPLNLSVLYGKQWINTGRLTFDYAMNLELALAE